MREVNAIAEHNWERVDIGCIVACVSKIASLEDPTQYADLFESGPLCELIILAGETPQLGMLCSMALQGRLQSPTLLWQCAANWMPYFYPGQLSTIVFDLSEIRHRPFGFLLAAAAHATSIALWFNTEEVVRTGSLLSG